MTTLNCARLSDLGVLPKPEKHSSIEVKNAADVNILRVNELECANFSGTNGIIRQGIDCRQHFIQAPPAGAPSATPIADYGDYVRDENSFQDGLNAERYWTKIGRRVRCTVTLFGTQLQDPTRPGRIFVGELPFRQAPFTQYDNVTGKGWIQVRNPQAGAVSNSAIQVTVTSDFEPRNPPDTYRVHPNMNGNAAWDALIFGPGGNQAETTGNGCYLILNIPGGVNPPAFGPNTCFGNVSFEYNADSNDIHPTSYVPPINPGTGQPFPCPWDGIGSPEFDPLLP